MEFRTEVKIEDSKWLLKETSATLMLGSCFAENIGKKFVDSKFNCIVNPFGVLYNPKSIFNALNMLLSEEVDLSTYLFQYNGMWGSWMHSTQFSATECETCLENITSIYNKAKMQLQQLDALFVTLGTNRYYELKESGNAVANCHKCPSSWFEEKEASLNEMVEQATVVMDKLIALRPEVKVVMTVSPYRYSKYGFHESKLAKANLLLLTDALQKRYPAHVIYFPAYEIFDDELRDYRFYADDMLHPSEKGVEYVWQRFGEKFIAPEAKQFMNEWNSIRKKLMHRSLHGNAEAEKLFQQALLTDIQLFKERYPQTDVNEELLRVQQWLKNVEK